MASVRLSQLPVRRRSGAPTQRPRQRGPRHSGRRRTSSRCWACRRS